jgi:putative addiction module component (TIGR02574 family)
MSSATMDISIDQLRRLPLEKRLELIEALWDSLEQTGADLWPISREIIDEANREFEAHLADPGSSIPWETVRARLFERYG